ncbi:regulation of nuclear pre-mRNA domain-containing protein 2-like isoform X2 [Antennarius striatus]|uniref:regulation of nuclear pre-mRNA domain-containing protein 2-like isoform X2 n=1 Tax=Antennarius striatus TaxID=241820 RepID=UPI0035B38D9B
MAAGPEAASGHGTRSSNSAFEASLDRRFQGVSNTMESIQGLSTWCIENKKHHSLIVRYWMKWLKKSDNVHRLNLFYLANDVIQNCKRKNAIVFRSAFADVLPSAGELIKDGKVRKSVERIFSIWEERSVYPEEVISQFKAGLNKKEKEREKQKEKEKEKVKEKEVPLAKAPTNTKAALKSKIVAEFTPNSLIEQLSKYKRAVVQEELKEKQLAALRVDVCSAEALKRLKDKAEGNKFAKDFEDNSLKLQEFVSILEKELKTGPPLLEAMGNADIFYEMQYKEVKIVANAYNAFANRVTSLKRKLDSLKSTLPGAEDSPIPSPSEDAPSPTGSDSPFLGLGGSRAQVDPELDGKAMDEGEMPSDNRDTEDMDMSEEEADAASAGDEKKDKVAAAAAKTTKPEVASKPPATPTKAYKSSAAATSVTPTSAAAQNAPTTPLGVNLEKVDLGKISSILSSLTSAMKNTASPTRPSPGTPTTPSSQSATSKVTSSSPALASILSRVDITPEGILNALSKANTPGLSSLLQSVTNTSAAPPSRTSPESSAVKTLLSPIAPKTKPILGNSLKRDAHGRTRDWGKERQLSPPPPPPPPPPPRPSAPSISPPSLESKINSFLQGNPGFSLALGDVSPDGVDGTPVRDEAAGTPTQDEIMDTPGSVSDCQGKAVGHNLSPTAYRSEPWDAVITPSGSSSSNGDFLGSSRYRAGKKSDTKLKDDEVMNVRKRVSSSPINDMKGKKDAQHSMMGTNRGLGERRLSAGSRKASIGSDDGSLSGKAEDKVKGQRSPAAGEKGGQYHRIETLVSPCTEGAPIQTLGYSNRPLAGERIKTVESIRVIGRGSRRDGGTGSRPGGVMWYEEEEYMEAEPPSPHIIPPLPLNIGQGGAEDMTPMPPPISHLMLQHLPPPLSHPHSLPPPPSPFQMPYHAENMQTPPPSLLHQHPPPASPFFGIPPIPRPPPPPIPQHPSPPPIHSTVPSAVMVGGMLVPVDRPLSLPPPIRPEGTDRSGMGPRGSKAGPPPLMSSLLGEPPKLPRPGTVKEPFVPRHAASLHRPGTSGVPLPLLGRVKEPLSLPLPSSSPSPTSSTTTPSTPPAPGVDTVPPRLTTQSAAPPLLKPPTSPPAQPRNQTSNPVPLLNLPSPRPPILPLPIPQRPSLRGRNPSQHLNRDLGGFRGGKRPGPPFTGGPFHSQKRPFQPPRY